ncbi:hypothetical protein VT84_08850 [Gemmata sp. SH-PL17]|uniref:DUF58 domain-containing protein n=1 Tax=Gemmata sp. SH-PL17 TaxID=1630693 RepID=UPI00078C8B73|nr:DUF58 domain-containing protein [Gemmata sp. SH-PL17]AMV24492.1 hypothetical protein VT84_08850 [Gemmata sp. SH-PL17]
MSSTNAIRAPSDTTVTNPLDPAVLSRIDRLELEARLAVEGYLAGKHRSPRQGLAVEFAQHREYAPGDDVKHIDWAVYARTKRYFLKQYEQETNLVAWLVVDASESMGYGSGTRTKYDLASTAAAAMAYLVLQQADTVGLSLVANGVRAVLRPSGQMNQLREACRVMSSGPFPGGGGIARGVDELAGRTGRRGVVFLFSDLLDDVPDILAALQHLRYQKHEVILFHTLDTAELDFPFRQTTLFRGLEGLPEILTDPSGIRDSYLKALHDHIDAIETGCRRLEIDYVRLRTDADLGHDLAAYLQKRHGR